MATPAGLALAKEEQERETELERKQFAELESLARTPMIRRPRHPCQHVGAAGAPCGRLESSLLRKTGEGLALYLCYEHSGDKSLRTWCDALTCGTRCSAEAKPPGYLCARHLRRVSPLASWREFEHERNRALRRLAEEVAPPEEAEAVYAYILSVVTPPSFHMKPAGPLAAGHARVPPQNTAPPIPDSGEDNVGD